MHTLPIQSLESELASPAPRPEIMKKKSASLYVDKCDDDGKRPKTHVLPKHNFEIGLYYVNLRVE
jgi:hypothetical protein